MVELDAGDTHAELEPLLGGANRDVEVQLELPDKGTFRSQRALVAKRLVHGA